MIDEQVRQVGQDVGQLGETRLMLMGALLVADLLTELQDNVAALEAEVTALKADQGRPTYPVAPVRSQPRMRTTGNRIFVDAHLRSEKTRDEVICLAGVGERSHDDGRGVELGNRVWIRN